MINRWLCAAALLLSLSSTQAEDFPRQDAKISADDLLKNVKGPKAGGWDITIFATPPDISYPTAVCATPWGEVFIATDQNGNGDRNPNRGWVTRCIDVDGHGTKFSQFAKMDSPRAVFSEGDTVYVLHPPFVTSYKNVDGVSSNPTDIIQGVAVDLKTRNNDHSTNGLRMGIDGWLYIVCGDYGAKKAVSLKDGVSLQLHGGGILRVRPDGTELEMFVHGTRNLYDVAITPTLDFFARDNTNDGGGWDSRLDQMVNGANYGYPGLFKNFQSEVFMPLADYGMGGATGSVWASDPLLPKGYNSNLFTNDWTRNIVYLHSLTRDGASYKITQEEFMHISQPTGIDEDGAGHLFVASWRGARFNFNGPNVGFLVRANPTGLVAPKFPDLKKTSDEELVALMESPSAPWRLQFQREIIRRGNKPAFVDGMQKLAQSGKSIDLRVLAIFTLKQLQGPESHEFLLKLLKDDDLREYVLRALADRKKEVVNLPADVFVSALADPSPRVRLQAVVAIGRLGRIDLADTLLPVTSDKDPVVAHVAVQTLVGMDAVAACFKGIDSSSPTMLSGAFRALQQLHEDPVVTGLIDRLAKLQDPTAKELDFAALCRLAAIEAEWDGKWWDIRPDTRGPYYHAVAWAQTDAIKAALSKALDSATGDLQQQMASAALLNHVDIPHVLDLVRKNAKTDPKIRAELIRQSLESGDVSDDALAAYQSVATSGKEDAKVRAMALRGMLKAYDKPANLANLIGDLSNINENSDGALKAVWNEFVHDNRNGNNSPFFLKLAEDESASKRDLAYSALVYMAASTFTKRDVKNTVNAFLVESWKKPPSAISLLHAITRLKDDRYMTEIQTALKDSDSGVQKAASQAQSAIRPPDNSGAPTIAATTYDQALAGALKGGKGDAKLGEQLFASLGCINCHTTRAGDPLKGPFLGGIAQRYNREYLAESVLKPSAKIAHGFETQTFELNDGTQTQGFVVKESDTQVDLRNLQGIATTLEKKDIKTRGKLETSPMPTGLADRLTTPDFISLLTYLESLPAQ